MKKLTVSVLVILILLMALSEMLGFGVYNGYRVDSDSKVERYVSLDKDAIVTTFSPNLSTDSEFLKKGATVIFSYVQEVEYYRKFLLIKRKPLENICVCNDSCHQVNLNPYNRETYRICTIALEKSFNYEYWIIDTTRNFIYGPFQKEAFRDKCDQLKIKETSKLL